MNYTHANDPNAGRLIESLRHLGYSNYEALADLVDNALDADATSISVIVQKHGGTHQIAVVDDGRGMSKSVLDQAMRLGSDTTRDINSDLGKFGMGLVTASLSIARKCHVLTCGEDGLWSSAWDIDEILSQKRFVKHFAAATADEHSLFREYLGAKRTGTVVILTKCDNLSNKSTTSFANTLRNHLGRVHRYFISAGTTIAVNADRASAIDPLQLIDEETEVVFDDTISVSFGDGEETKSEAVRVRLVLVPEEPLTDLDVGKSLKAQGFYVLRNQREIMSAQSLFFTKHNDFNRMRGEIFLPGTLDRFAGIEFTKRQIEFEQSLQDQLASTLIPLCRTIKRREATKKRVPTGDAQQKLHAQSVKVIAEKGKLLIKPKAVIEKRSSPRNPGQKSEALGVSRDRTFTRTQMIESDLNCVIREERLGPNGQIYECEMEGRKLVIRYNVEHPFYQRFVSDNLPEARVVSATDFLIYSMASAELKVLDDGNLEIVNNFKAVLSANLRTLLN